MRRFRQPASGRRLWHPTRTLFVCSLILGVAVVASIAAVATGGTQDPSAWTWSKGGGGTSAAASSSKAGSGSAVNSAATSGSAGSSGSVVVAQSAKNDTSPALRGITPVPFSPSANHVVPVLPLGKQLTNRNRAVNGAVQTKVAAPKTQVGSLRDQIAGLDNDVEKVQRFRRERLRAEEAALYSEGVRSPLGLAIQPRGRW